MYSYDATGIIGDEQETILDGMKTCFTTLGQLIIYIEMILFTQLFPIFLLDFRQYEDDMQ